MDNSIEYLNSTETNTETNNTNTNNTNSTDNAEKLTEAWKPVDGFPKYQVSSQGRIRNVESGRIFTGTRDAFGYKHVRLINPQGTYTLRKVHRLVAEAFLPNPEGKPIIDHRDGDKTNNTLDNLRWVTYSENILAGEKRRKEANPGKRTNTNISLSRKIAQYTLDGELVATFDKISEITKTLGIGRYGIYCTCYGKLRSNGGFMWRFFNGEPEKSIEPYSDKRQRAIYSISDGKRTDYPSIDSAAEELAKLKGTLLNGKVLRATKNSIKMVISANLHGKTNTAYGRIWKYV